MSIKIRKALSEDSSFLADMILKSSRAEKPLSIFDIIFNSKNDKQLLKTIEKFIKTGVKHRCHYSNFLIAEIDGKDVGSLCSYEPRIATNQTFLDGLTEIKQSVTDNQTLELLQSCDFEFNTRTLIFDFMEEIDGFIDVGILKSLMQKSLLTARLKGYTIAQTIVEIGSLEVLLFYKKLGFKEVKSLECELYREKFGRAGLILLAIEF